MEGGSPFVEYVTYAMIGVVLFALGFLALRTAKFFLSLLAIPLFEAAARWAPAARVLARWGDRGGERDPTSWRATLVPREGAKISTRREVPRAVRRAMTLGATLGAVPGVWHAVNGALRVRAAGGGAGEIAATVGIAIGLVAAAGMLAGGAIGAVVGVGIDQLRDRGR